MRKRCRQLEGSALLVGNQSLGLQCPEEKKQIEKLISTKKEVMVNKHGKELLKNLEETSERVHEKGINLVEKKIKKANDSKECLEQEEIEDSQNTFEESQLSLPSLPLGQVQLMSENIEDMETIQYDSVEIDSDLELYDEMNNEYV